MNDFVAKDTCILCGDVVSIVLNQRLVPINDGPHSLFLCDKCKKKLIDDKKLLIIEVTMNSKGQITRVTGRAAEMSDRALKESIPNYKNIMENRVIMVDKETFDYLKELGDGNGKA